MPSTGVCCSDGGYCDAGEICNDRGTCSVVSGGGGSGGGGSGGGSTCLASENVEPCDDKCMDLGAVCCNDGNGDYCSVSFFSLSWLRSIKTTPNTVTGTNKHGFMIGGVLLHTNRVLQKREDMSTGQSWRRFR